MRLMQRLGVELSSSEWSEGSIGPGYENVVILSWLLVNPFGKDLRTVSSPISSGSCSASFSSSLSHTEVLCVAVTDLWFLSFILCISG
jgi:hypothetical protein